MYKIDRKADFQVNEKARTPDFHENIYIFAIAGNNQNYKLLICILGRQRLCVQLQESAEKRENFQLELPTYLGLIRMKCFHRVRFFKCYRPYLQA